MATRKRAESSTPTAKTSPKPAAAGRRPGRPTGGPSGPEQRERLLDTALALFARQGIVDTTLGAIAREAGVTPAMVHYYFKTREQLLDVLIDERFLPVRVAIREAFNENEDDPVAALTAVAQRFVDIAAERPWFPSLWVREVISDAGLLKQRMDDRFRDTHRKRALRWIIRWQKEGRLNPDLEPALVFPTLLGLTLLPLAASTTWRADPERRQIGTREIARHAVAVLTSGVGARTRNS
ncbi:TetR/AcrR family transcriptional regulator [Trinickia terrae]|uniref:TetR/AcrR family transcriptional regulator n=1 Tax=Trinickia terrae TaxID=2571161 RepID=A0A4U1IFD8_9BURK|nr:TetR/AcrR family transcriptional regulator [Trinickia terrae]TKC92446.1 TetR/AcrR family transcriptional regulator [Trinickia terrae]